MDRRIAFEEMYGRHEPAVRAFVLRRIGDSSADDVVSEVFLAAWRRFEDTPTDPLPWLLRIARGALSNRRRGENRRTALVERLSRERGLARVEAQQAADIDWGVFEALGSLSENDQELLLLAAWEGLSNGQIAVVLGASRGTVAVRLHRARQRFARVVNQRSPAGQSRSSVEVS